MTVYSIPVAVKALRVPLDRLEDVALVRMLEYWRAIKGDAAIPLRSSLRPEDMPFTLAAMNMIEVRRDPLNFIVRLQGTQVQDCHRQDLTGHSLDCAQPAVYAAEVRRQYEEVVRNPDPTAYFIELVEDFRRISYLRLLMPLSRDGDGVDFLLTACIWDADPPTADRLL